METLDCRYFEEFFKMSTDLMMISRVQDAIYIAVNDGFTKLLGYTEEEVLHKSALDLGIWEKPQDRQKVAEEIKKNGILQNLESRFRAKNGTIISVLLSASIITINQVDYFIGTAKDITEIKQKEKIIQESEERFKELSEISPVGIYLTNNGGLCLYVNQCWRTMSGLTFEEALGKEWIKGIHPEDRQMVFDNWNKMVEEEGKWGIEFRFQDKSGKVTWVYGVASPRRDSSGKIVGYVGVNVDITDRVTIQEKERETHERLSLAGVY